MSRVSFAVPRGWMAVTLGEDPAHTIEEVVATLVGRGDHDGSAVARHWLRARLAAASRPPDDARCEVVGLLLASAPVAGVTLPVTAQVLRLDPDLMCGEPMRDLAVLAAQDPTSRPLVVGGGVALRTHEVRDAAGAVRAEVQRAPLTSSERARMVSDLDSAPALRARYFLPGVAGTAWHVAAFTAMLGHDDPVLRALYLDLFDAVIQSMRVDEDVP